MKYLIITDHPRNDIRVNKSQKHLDNVTLQIPRLMAKFKWVSGYCFVVYLLTFFYKFDRIYTHDLWTSYAGVKRNKPVICDLHENYIDCFIHNTYKFKLLKWFFRPTRIYKMLRVITTKADKLVVSSRLSTQIYDTPYFYDNVQNPSCLGKFNNYIPVVVFIGRNRYLEKVNWRKIKHRFILVVMSENAPKLATPDNIKVVYTGSNKTGNDTNQYWLDRASIGLLPNLQSNHTYTCSPNKLFAYMDKECCVLYHEWMGNVKEITDRYNCGYGTNDIAAGLDYLLGNMKLTQEFARNGRKAVLNSYNEESIIKPLFDEINN